MSALASFTLSSVLQPPPKASADRWVIAGLVTVVFATVVLFLAQGTGYVLDDWYILRNAHFDGSWASAGAGPGAARPGSYPVFALVFGVFAGHPLPAFLALAAVNAATAVLTFRLLDRFVSTSRAALVALLWVVLPTHTSTELWLTGSIIAASQLALTGGLLLSVQPDRRGWQSVLAWLLLGTAVATYEASLPVAAVGAVVLPWIVRGRIDLRFVVGAAIGCGIPVAWLLTHWFGGKTVQPWANVGLMFPANFGWGVTPGTATVLAQLLAGLVLVGITTAVSRLILRSAQVSVDEWMVVAGLVVMVLGFLPFARYFYQPLGAGDRVNYLSAVGASLVWVGLAAIVSRVDRRVAATCVIALLGVALAARWERIGLWAAAGRDAQSIADDVVARFPDPQTKVVLGPEPIIRQNVTAFYDVSNVEGALSIAYGEPHADVGLAKDGPSWAAAAEYLRFDMGESSELDDR